MSKIKKYYDNYGSWYDKERTNRYYSLLSSLEINTVKSYAKNRKVLEIGCGTGLILNQINKIAKETAGIDISEGMLKQARKKGLNVKKADVLSLPFKDSAFDVVYSFKVLAHVPKIKEAIKEITRVVKKNGILILEFYNPFSLKYIANKIGAFFSKNTVYTRYDNYFKIKSYLPKNLKIISIKGIRIFTPVSAVYKIPLLSELFAFSEKAFSDTLLKFLGGYFILVLKNENK